MTTTNGTRALWACRKANLILACAFLNLKATAEVILRLDPGELLLVCSGTLDQAAYEDVLGAGALCDLLWQRYQDGRVADSAVMAQELYRKSQGNLEQALSRSRNGSRLMSKPELREDVAFCCRKDKFPLVASLGADGVVRRTE
jgi:2-phosphosulfolactate phosphatase